MSLGLTDYIRLSLAGNLQPESWYMSALSPAHAHPPHSIIKNFASAKATDQALSHTAVIPAEGVKLPRRSEGAELCAPRLSAPGSQRPREPLPPAPHSWCSTPPAGRALLLPLLRPRLLPDPCCPD